MAEEEKKTEIKEKAAVDKTAGVNTSTAAAPEPAPAAAPEAVKYNYAEAEEKFTAKDGTHHVKVSKTVNEIDESKPIISQTVTHEVSGKKHDASGTEVTIDTYSTIGGHSTKTTTFDHDFTYRDKGKKNIKQAVEGYSERTTNAGDGTLAVSTDKTAGYSFGNESVRTTNYNKDGTIASTHQHTTVHSSSYNSQTDEYTELKKGEVKKSLKAQAANARLIVEATDKKKKTDFTAEYSANGNERFIKTKKDKAYDVSVEGGVASGKVLTLSQDGETVVKEQELSKKQLKKELKSMRQEADRTVAQVSNAKTAEEYLAAIPAPSKVGQVNLSDVFNADLGGLKKAEPEVVAKHQAQVKENASLTAEQILQMRKQQIQQQ